MINLSSLLFNEYLLSPYYALHLSCPTRQPLVTDSYSGPEMQLVGTKMGCKCIKYKISRMEHRITECKLSQ